MLTQPSFHVLLKSLHVSWVLIVLVAGRLSRASTAYQQHTPRIPHNVCCIGLCPQDSNGRAGNDRLHNWLHPPSSHLYFAVARCHCAEGKAVKARQHSLPDALCRCLLRTVSCPPSQVVQVNGRLHRPPHEHSPVLASALLLFRARLSTSTCATCLMHSASVLYPPSSHGDTADMNVCTDRLMTTR